MRTFTVYRHPDKGYEAVKKGFSWPGFIFTWLWAVVKGVGPIWVLLLFIGIVAEVLSRNREPGLIILGFGIGMTMRIVVGVQGNKWREESLASRGYQPVETFQAASPDAATNRIIEEAKLNARVDAAVKDALEHKPAESGSAQAA